ncbi:peptidase family C50-domain-containing protein [Irpex rosettiformis]|uniref:Peptidase family C50-domain-containing protein n=1 Tax=Irpex rosettiformis TaxID=378272 RepID=A0ACB8U6I0_9APHY|nr:peptidase family C50-domain-containing protein [Irpex rosettiformis]
MRPRRQAPSTTNAPRTRSAGTSRSTAEVASEPEPHEQSNAPSTERLATRMASRLKASTQDKVKEKQKESDRDTVSRPRVPARSRTKTATKSIEADALADIVEQKLVIDDTVRAKGKTKEEICAEAMRAVNTASKKLSAIAETGWKSSVGSGQATRSGNSTKAGSLKIDRTAAQVNVEAIAVREGLVILRENRPWEMDIERAACSAAGKLISLESYQSAIPILQDMYPVLSSYYLPSSKATATSNNSLTHEFDILSLPLPESPISSDNVVLLTLLTSYLMYTHIATSWSLFYQLSAEDLGSAAASESLYHFAHTLHTSSTLLQWLPYLRSFSSKHIDSALTRVYTALTKSSSLPSVSSYSVEQTKSIYRIRLYSLLLLVNTSPGALKSSTFWDQCVKFTAAYVKSILASDRSSSETQNDVTEVVLESFDTILQYAEKRSDRDDAKEGWMKGEAFVAFCEYWIEFATRAKDLKVITKVSRMIRLASSSASTEARDITPTPRAPSMLQASDICAALTQTTALLEQGVCSDAEEFAIEDTMKVVDMAQPFIVLAFRHGDDASALYKAAHKVWRAFERLRRAVLKASEMPSPSPGKPQRDGLEKLTRKIVDMLSNILTSADTGHAELLTCTLDSLFTLAKSALDTNKPRSIDISFNYLSRALALVTSTSETCVGSDDVANFLRCISGAFHNLGATLYQAGHYSHAVRFFDKSCPVGEDALSIRRTSTTSGRADEEADEQKKSERDTQWTTLEEQLHRRWEILGVCHSKMGDRKAAFTAFRRCIKSFPFHSDAFLEKTKLCSNITLWEDSPSIKHIAGIIDRMTYTGICDLFLPVEEVSLKGLFTRSTNVKENSSLNAIAGALLERQVDGLDGVKWKPAVHSMMGKLLQDALEVYNPQKMPVRRARVMLKCLEMACSTNGKATSIVDDLEEFVIEADGLLQTNDLGLDTGLAGFSAQYWASLRLRMAHLVHQQIHPSPTSRIVTYVDDACGELKSVLTPLPRQSLAKPASPIVKKVQTARRTGKRQAVTSRTPATRSRGRTAKVASAQPVTPKSRKLSSVMPPPIPRLTFGTPPALEYAPALLDLLHSTAHLLGLLGSVVKKVQVLVIGRRMSEQHAQSRPDDYVRFSTELAHEYVNLGKTNKAANIYSHTWNAINTLQVSDETRVLFLLRYSESLIAMGNVLKSSASYTEAYGIAQTIDNDSKSVPSVQRIIMRASLLERAAVASTTFSSIQYTRDDPVTSINGLLQSLRLWNRAFDTLSRLAPPSPQKQTDDDNPFLQTETKADNSNAENFFQQAPGLGGLGWRISEGLLNTLFALTRAYVSRGSPREAEFFAQQAKDLAASLNMPAMVSRAFSRLGEIYLHLGQLNESHACLAEAANLVSDAGGPDAAEIRRLRAEHSRVNENKKDARQLYDEAISLLGELEHQFTVIDGHGAGPRKSLGMSPKAPKMSSNDTLAPSLLLSILRQNIVMLHAEGGEYQELLDRLRSLPPTAELKAEESALMAKLKLEDVYARFQADMFLSSLAESAITLPMGMKKQKNSISASTQEILAILNHAEKLFWSDLGLVAKRGNVFHVRDAAISLALIKAFQDTLGKTGTEGPTLAACLLDRSTAITLRREVLEVVQYKFGDFDGYDDLQWPLVTPSGSPMSPPKALRRARFMSLGSGGDEEEIDNPQQATMRAYWQALTKKYQEQPYDSSLLSSPHNVPLPQNWTVISISVTEDKNTMFVTRQCPDKEPLIFYIPLKERREGEDEEYLSFDEALAELREIIRLSDEGTKDAVNVKNREARAAWWANRSALDKRMKQLLDNIEFCWLGAFKTILSSPRHIPSRALNDLRTRLETIFDQSIAIRDRKQALSVQLDDALLECFVCLSPKARDEELEDLVYFILDLYQFHGIPIAIAEVDIDQVVIDFRSALEDHRTKYGSQVVPQNDSHMFLVLDKNVQGIPWESIPILRGQSVSRIPSIDFLLDRLYYAKLIQGKDTMPVDRLIVNPRETFFVLNPSGDLKNTEGRFVDWLREMKEVGWTGIVGKVPSELQFADALTKKDLLIYFGHGGAEQYIRSRKVRHLPRCAATMLWGCSSGELKEMGDFDRAGTPYNYMLAGCPTLVANLWDVTDRDIDKFSQSVFDKMHLTPEAVDAWQPHTDCDDDRMSIVTAVAESRDACKLKYLTGAAPVVYGIPFYL